MTLLDIVRRTAPYLPSLQGQKIPWHDPDFSRRMLREHLSQDHDAASRCAEVIDRQVAWLHERILAGRPSRVLDVCCGPGLYCERLAKLGHLAVGLDFSPAAIDYAVSRRREELRTGYRRVDVRKVQFGWDFDLVLLIHGEFNAFSIAESDDILRKAHVALAPEGTLVLEVNAPGDIASSTRCTWTSAKSGLFTDRPHLCLEEVVRDAATRTEATRWHIVDAETADVTRYAQVIRLYSHDQYVEKLTGAGFHSVEFLPSLAGSLEDHYVTIVAHKAESGG
ncbi:class I SAM-dependent methyltransferase [bacterium]|nr:class I SAM-dependent methyltransferase [bacterium]